MDKTKVKLPKTWYLGLVSRKNEELPLGFMTPDGNDAAAIKRKATVDSWANSPHSNNIKLPSKTIDNIPMVGFKIKDNVRHGFQSEGKWRVEDPRGFELEITNDNFCALLQDTVFDHGEIQDPCVWVRYHSSNWLILQNSEYYKFATENERRQTLKDIPVSSLEPGDRVVLNDNSIVTFLGTRHILKYEYNISDLNRLEKVKYHFIKYEELNGYVELKNTLKIKEILGKDISADEANTLIGIKITEPNLFNIDTSILRVSERSFKVEIKLIPLQTESNALEFIKNNNLKLNETNLIYEANNLRYKKVFEYRTGYSYMSKSIFFRPLTKSFTYNYSEISHNPPLNETNVYIRHATYTDDNNVKQSLYY